MEKQKEFESLLGKGVVVIYDERMEGVKTLKGVLLAYTPPFLTIDSFGQEICINSSFVIKLKASIGESK